MCRSDERGPVCVVRGRSAPESARMLMRKLWGVNRIRHRQRSLQQERRSCFRSGALAPLGCQGVVASNLDLFTFRLIPVSYLQSRSSLHSPDTSFVFPPLLRNVTLTLPPLNATPHTLILRLLFAPPFFATYSSLPLIATSALHHSFKLLTLASRLCAAQLSPWSRTLAALSCSHDPSSFVLTHTTITSEQPVAKLFVLHIFSKHGVPSHVTLDQGLEFVLAFFQALGQALSMQLHYTSGYHRQTEQVNQTLEQYLWI